MKAEIMNFIGNLGRLEVFYVSPLTTFLQEDPAE